MGYITYVYDQKMDELDIPYHTKLPCQIEVDIDGNIINYPKNWTTDVAKWTTRNWLKSIRWLGHKNAGHFILASSTVKPEKEKDNISPQIFQRKSWIFKKSGLKYETRETLWQTLWT